MIFKENKHPCYFVNIIQVEAWKMAKAGLLYTGQEEQVKCTFCGCLLSDWQYGDQVSTLQGIIPSPPTVGIKGGMTCFCHNLPLKCICFVFHDENGKFKCILTLYKL